MDYRHPTADRDRLRAFFLTNPALDALPGTDIMAQAAIRVLPGVFPPFILPAGKLGPVVDVTFIIITEIPRDINPLRARHAIPASGARDDGEFFVFGPHFLI